MTARPTSAVRRRIPCCADSAIEVELSWSGLTDVGRRREVNQDSFITAPPIFAVADGMGGHAGGEIASAAVTNRLSELASSGEISEPRFTAALQTAIWDMARQTSDADAGTGTTVTGFYLESDEGHPIWKVFNIGDSRVYQYFKGALTQITVDHSVVQHLIDTGQITAEEAEVHPHANVITRAVGLGDDPHPDFSMLALIPGQRLLVCSDGLTKELTETGIQHFLATADTAEAAAAQLMQHAIDNAGRDNITVVVVDVHAVGDARETQPQGKETP